MVNHLVYLHTASKQHLGLCEPGGSYCVQMEWKLCQPSWYPLNFYCILFCGIYLALIFNWIGDFLIFILKILYKGLEILG